MQLGGGGRLGEQLIGLISNMNAYENIYHTDKGI